MHDKVDTQSISTNTDKHTQTYSIYNKNTFLFGGKEPMAGHEQACHAQPCRHTHICTYTHTCTYMQTHTYMHIHAHMKLCSNIYTCTHMQTHIYAHAGTHICTHAAASTHVSLCVCCLLLVIVWNSCHLLVTSSNGQIFDSRGSAPPRRWRFRTSHVKLSELFSQSWVAVWVQDSWCSCW